MFAIGQAPTFTQDDSFQWEEEDDGFISQTDDSLNVVQATSKDIFKDSTSSVVDSLNTKDIGVVIQQQDSLVTDSLTQEKDSTSIFTSDSLILRRDSITNILHRWTDTLYWKNVQPHYVIFDSMSVNPYKIDGAKYKDTTHIILYDTLQGNWSMPLKDHYVTSNFGHRGHRYHYGTDLRLSIGDSVRSVFDGIVRISKYNPGGYGNYVLVRHYNGLETIYGHLSKRLVKVGQHVKAGELIGKGGNTGRSSGPHLHFEVRYQGNAFNPKSLYNFESDTLMYSSFDLTPKYFKHIRDARRAVYHRIRSGESLWVISRKYRTSIRTICRLNGITTRTVLRVGRRLRVR